MENIIKDQLIFRSSAKDQNALVHIEINKLRLQNS